LSCVIGSFHGLRLRCYNVPEVSESVILSAIFFTKGVTAIVIGCSQKYVEPFLKEIRYNSYIYNDGQRCKYRHYKASNLLIL
jgi:hypothetical protein